MPERVWGKDGKCVRCGQRPLYQSFDGPVRRVLKQIQHVANREAGLCPSAADLAGVLGMPLAEVLEVLDHLKDRDIIADLPKGMAEAHPGQYIATVNTHGEALRRADHERQLAQKQLLNQDEQRDVERDLRLEVQKLESRLGTNSATGGRLKAANKRIKELEQALEDLRQMIERGAIRGVDRSVLK